MSIWKRLLYWIGLRPNPGPRYFEISESLQVTLSTLAEREGRPEEEFAQELLAAGLTEYNFGDSEFLMLLLVIITLPFAANRDGGLPT